MPDKLYVMQDITNKNCPVQRVFINNKELFCVTSIDVSLESNSMADVTLRLVLNPANITIANLDESKEEATYVTHC